ncbi:DUF6083 domain-containing protein [Streptomyces sp. NPDC004647]|uniref:DUF6083 domain-containing protein n=1 Tax=Streptomyces sp. NPDC004647 TaxID=3154671 RepID=UPI0033A6E605
MRPTPTPPGHRWDGTPHTAHHPRALRVTPTSASRLLRTAQTARCHDCTHPIDWYYRTEPHQPIALHPHELPTTTVPTTHRWHTSSGIAHPAGDGTPWCRIPHTLLCPAHDTPAPTPQLAELRRRLAVCTRRRRDTGAPTQPSNIPPAQPPACRPARPVVQIFYLRYLAPCPLEDIQCVAQTRDRRRCTAPVLASNSPQGTWALLPTNPGHHQQLALPATTMAIYDLSHLPYAEQMSWRAQRCPQHAAAPTAADAALTDWQPFDPLAHHQHIHDRLPTLARRRGARHA